MSGPRVQKKRGEKEKRENSKKITGKKRKKIRISKKEKKKEQKGQISKSSWVLCSGFFIKKQKQKASQTQLSQEKTQDQRKLLLKCDFL